MDTLPERARAGPRRRAGRRCNAAVARVIVGVHRRQAGRGPTKARAFFRHDVVVAVLQGALTVTERSLIADDRQNAVAQLRIELNAAMRPSMARSVEALTACRVVACTSDTDIEAGTSSPSSSSSTAPLDLDEAHRAIERHRVAHATPPAPPG